MTHVVEVRLKLHLDEVEMHPGDTPTLAAERFVRKQFDGSLQPEELRSLEFTELVR